MGHLGKAIQRRGAYLIRCAVVALELRKARLDRRIARLERVIGRIGDFGRILGVIGPVCRRQERRKPPQFGLRLAFGQILNGKFVGHRPLADPGCGGHSLPASP